MVDKIHKYSLNCIGEPFDFNYSSCADLVPLKFKWVKENGDYDVYIDYGMKNKAPNLNTPKEKRFGWVCESKFIVPDLFDWLKKNYNTLFDLYYNKIFTCEQELLNLSDNFVYSYAGSNFPWIKEKLWSVYPKTKICSMFCSSKTLTQLHIYRHKVAKRAINVGVDVFGPTFTPLQTNLSNFDSKINGIRDYMFHIVIENGLSENYFTEKITDCIAVGTIPVYRGAKKILELFDSRGIILLEPDREDEILSSLTEELYRDKLQYVHKNLEILKTLELADDFIFNNIQAL